MTVGEFRAAVRSWLDARDLARPGGHSMDAQVAQLARVRRELYDAGWMRYGWPETAGGFGGPAALRAVLAEEVAARDLAEPGLYSMTEVLVPTLISYAPPSLTAEMVPRLLSGREQWCQGFSEPGSGSDLASLSTQAVPRGDSWVVTGQKVWTSLAQFAARCVLLTRTAPGHGGITAFFVDMTDSSGNTGPGITVRPLRTMHGVDEFAEVFFDDVVVPSSRMLGNPGDGWRLASDLLPYERSTCFWHRNAYLFERLDRLVAAAAVPDEAAVGAAYLSLYMTRCRSRETQYRLAATGTLGPETSVDKILLSTTEQAVFDLAAEGLAESVLFGDDADSEKWRSEFLYSRAATIYGGSLEIQRNIVARRLLDLGPES